MNKVIRFLGRSGVFELVSIPPFTEPTLRFLFDVVPFLSSGAFSATLLAIQELRAQKARVGRQHPGGSFSGNVLGFSVF